MTAYVIRGTADRLPLPDNSVDLIVTSPPYYALREYRDGAGSLAGQVGSEPTPAAYIAALVECTREWVRVLKPGGSIFVNLGDKYSDRTGGQYSGRGTGRGPQAGLLPQTRGPMEKSLLLLPERYRLACVDELGLIARAVIVWSKPNGLPESVTDRARRSHEDWVHLTRSPRYFAAVDEIREGYAPGTAQRYAAGYNARKVDSERPSVNTKLGGDTYGENPLGKLPGSVWTVPTEPLKVPAHLGVSHFAAFPLEWPRRLIQGWSPSGVCTRCGEGRRPVATAVALNMDRPEARRAHELAERGGLTEAHFRALLSVGISDTGRGAATQSGTGKNRAEVYALADEARSVLGGYAREYLLRRPTEFRYVCACSDPTAPTRPSVILDPFGGTGTTALVASVLGRVGVTVDLSADYCRLARWRTRDPGERARALRVEKPAPQVQGQIDLFAGSLP